MFNNTALVAEIDNLTKFAYRLTGNMPDAEDLVQATALRALEKKHLFEKDTNLLNWMSKIMFNLFATSYRRRTKFETRFNPEDCLKTLSIKPYQEFYTDFSNVCDVISRLSKKHREILICVCIKGMRYKEVARILKIPLGTVRSRLFRAREQLQDVMEQRQAGKMMAYENANRRGETLLAA